MIKTKFAILFGKIISLLCKSFGLGAGVTWAGEIALKVNPKILSSLFSKKSIIVFVAGTNGKTTTAKLLVTALRNAGKIVVTNESGANLLNGIVGSLITQPRGEIYVLEVDENNLVRAMGDLRDVGKVTVVLLNLFRDQLDRYGETDKIAKDWSDLANWTNLVINGDDPQLAYLGGKFKKNVSYFGLGDKKFFLEKKPHATDSIFCPQCGARLIYQGYYLSHLGEYKCEKCGFGHAKNNKINKANKSNKDRISGVYNVYNYLAAELTLETLKIKPDFTGFKPAFGRSEEINGIKILLSKNPAGFNESIRTVINSKNKGPLLLVLNDRIPDGRDVSWIWDVDFEHIPHDQKILVAGDRRLDLEVRLKYGGFEGFEGFEKLEKALEKKPVWVLATYSGMLEVRKILTGRKIL